MGLCPAVSAPKSSAFGFGDGRSPEFATFAVNDGGVVLLVRWQVVDPLAVPSYVALDHFDFVVPKRDQVSSHVFQAIIRWARAPQERVAPSQASPRPTQISEVSKTASVPLRSLARSHIPLCTGCHMTDLVVERCDSLARPKRDHNVGSRSRGSCRFTPAA